MLHERLQSFVAIDYTRNTTLLAILKAEGREKTAGLGQYVLNPNMKIADLALVVRDDCHNQGIGFELISYLTSLAKRPEMQGFTGDALARNQPIFALINKMGFEVEMENESGVFKINLIFKDENQSHG